MNTLQYFEIQATKPKKVADFYAAVFGWEMIQDTSLPIEYWRIQCEGPLGAILQRPTAMPGMGQGTNAYVCSFEVASFDETAKVILSAGGRVALDKFAIAGKCWQGYFLDVDNNTFGIFEADEAAA